MKKNHKDKAIKERLLANNAKKRRASMQFVQEHSHGEEFEKALARFRRPVTDYGRV